MHTHQSDNVEHENNQDGSRQSHMGNIDVIGQDLDLLAEHCGSILTADVLQVIEESAYCGGANAFGIFELDPAMVVYWLADPIV